MQVLAATKRPFCGQERTSACASDERPCRRCAPALQGLRMIRCQCDGSGRPHPNAHVASRHDTSDGVLGGAEKTADPDIGRCITAEPRYRRSSLAEFVPAVGDAGDRRRRADSSSVRRVFFAAAERYHPPPRRAPPGSPRAARRLFTENRSQEFRRNHTPANQRQWYQRAGGALPARLRAMAPVASPSLSSRSVGTNSQES